MAQESLHRLKREELLQMLLELERENERLANDNRRLREELANRNLAVQEAGSLAEAALKLSRVFEAAQEAADLYLENIRNRASE